MSRVGPNGRTVDAAVFDVSDSATLSNIVDMSPGRLVLVRFPNLWQAANITFRVGMTVGDLANLYLGDGSEFTLTGGAGRWVAIENPNIFVGANLIQIRSGTSLATVNQTDDGEFTLIGARLYTG